MKAKWLLLLSSIFYLLYSKPAYAGNLENVSLKFSRLKANTQVTATICATPTTIGTENTLSLTFPPSFTLSQNSSHWTISNATWPGVTISTLTSDTATFTSGDLTVGTNYCFTLNNSLAINTGSAGTVHGSLTTNLDTKGFGVAILVNDQIAITGVVPPRPNDFTIALTASSSATPFAQNTLLGYTITYSSKIVGSVPVTIEVSWTLGTIGSSLIPTVDILDYVTGSATDAYGGAPPVVDLINRKITWTIPSLPGNIQNQTISFELLTNSNYTGDDLVYYSLTSRIISDSTATPPSSVYEIFRHDHPRLTPTPTTSSDNSTSTSTSTTTTTAQSTTPASPITPVLKITKISFTGVSQTTTDITAQTNLASSITLSLGTDYRHLTQPFISLPLQKVHPFALTGLKSDTQYFFRLTATTLTQKTTSDLYTFRTSSDKPTTILDPNSLIVTSNNNLLLYDNASKAFTIPTDDIYEINLHVLAENNQSLKSIELQVRNKFTLGVTSNGPDINTQSNHMYEIQPNLFTSKLKSPSPGLYEIIAQVFDLQGNLTTSTLANLLSVDPVTIVDGKTGKPLDSVLVTFHIFNQKSKIFEIISPQIISIKNPSFTNRFGQIKVVLPPNKYKITTLFPGYQESETIFTVDTKNPFQSPTIKLTPASLFSADSLRYLSLFSKDILASSGTVLKYYGNYNSIFIVLAQSFTILLVLLSLITFYHKTHFRLNHFLSKFIPTPPHADITGGIILDQTTKQPVSQAEISLFDAKDKRITNQFCTNKTGRFAFSSASSPHHKILIVKVGYEPEEVLLHSDNPPADNFHTIHLVRSTEFPHRLAKNLSGLVSEFFNSSFELIISIGLAFEIFCIFTFGWSTSIAAFVISFINLLAYLIFLHEKKPVIS